jgi:mRNA interferase RelE/StbE
LSYQVLIERRALKDLSKLPVEITRRASLAIDGLAAQPRAPGAKKLQGSRDQWRIRVGDCTRSRPLGSASGFPT